MATRAIAFNGKFLAAAPTGVHRVARELIRGVDALLQDPSEAKAAGPWLLFKPRDAYQTLALSAITSRTVGFNTWQPWEQIDLPIAARGDLLVSLCNLAPLAHGDAVTMIHDAQVFSSPESYGPAFREWYRFALPVIGRRARRILTVSEFSRQQLAEYGVAEYDRISVVYNGVDHLRAGEPEAGAAAALGLQPKNYVIALANVQRHKNVRLVIEAFSDPRLSSLKLVLVGKAGGDDFIKAGTTPPSNVVFAGPVDDARFSGLIQSALCFAFPSTTEGFGLPPLEAMTLGCPAMVAPCGSLPEVCGDAAVYGSSVDAADWVDKILELRDDPALRQRLVALGLEHSGRFTWRSSARTLMKEIADVRA